MPPVFVSNGDASAASETDRTSNFLPTDEKYRLTGEMPVEGDESQPAKRDDSAASGKETPQPGKDGASAASAADSTQSASQTQREARSEPRRENRWQKREREIRELKEENARLKSPQSQQQQRSEPAQVSQPATETAAKAAKPKLDDVDPKTNQPKYKNYAEYEDAKDAWLRQETIREFHETTARTQRETEQQRAEREIGQNLSKKFEPLRAKYPDFDKVALNENLTIPKGSAAETYFLDSDHAGEVLYYCGQHPEILNGFYSRNTQTGAVTSLVPPARVFRKLMEIENQIVGSGSGAASAAGESSTSTSSVKPITQASRPPHQVSGKGTVAKDAVEQALEDGDFESYQKAQNAKELARRKK